MITLTRVVTLYTAAVVCLFIFIPKETPCADGGGNCAKVGSCGVPGCRRVAGGSQFVYNNGVPACLVKERDCYPLQCRVKAYTTYNCTGEVLDDTDVDRLGCKARSRQ